MLKKGLYLFWLAMIVSVSFAAGFYFSQSRIPVAPPEGIINAELGQPEGFDFSLFWEAWHVLEERFVDPEKIDYQQMIYGAVSGMTGSLKDPYTVYMPPEDSKIFKEDVSGEFSGVGMEIGIRQDELTVIAPLEGTPAQKAGLLAGDKIVKIDDTSSRGIAIDEAVKLIRGQKGTAVVLTIFREGWSQAKEFEIVRDVIEIPSLTWELKDKEIAHLKLYHFSETARLSFQKVAVEILNSQAKAIVLDLRNNPGGYLQVAQDIAGWFLEKGQLVTIEDFGGKQENKEYKANGSGQLLGYPLVVLINQGSASGSEILAGALRDNRGILLVGEQSFGKGSVQTLEELKEGSIKVTVAKWLTPKGQTIEGQGLEPDLVVDMTEDDYNQDRDPQLDKAIELIKEMR